MARIDGKEREQWQAALDKERKRADEWKQNAKNLKSQCGSRWKDQKKWREKTKKAEAKLKEAAGELEKIADTWKSLYGAMCLNEEFDEQFREMRFVVEKQERGLRAVANRLEGAQ